MFLEKNPSIWLGQGFITLRGIVDQMRFFTRWTIGEEILQEVEIQGIEEKQVNLYTISHDLIVTLENESLGLWEGRGERQEHHLSWKLFSPDKSLFGEEHFFHLPNGRIKTRAIFSDPEGSYTLVEGEIRQALPQSSTDVSSTTF